MINVRSINDISVLNNRYAVIKDTAGTYRVVSLLRTPFRELQARQTSIGISYVFNRTGMGPSCDKQSYNQADLQRLVKNYGKAPTTAQVLDLSNLVNGISNRAAAVAHTKPSDFAGLPSFDNRQLHPQKGGWIIATVTNDGLLFGSKPKIHCDVVSAEAELQRLATVSPGTEFVLLKAVKTAITQTVQTKEFA